MRMFLGDVFEIVDDRDFSSQAKIGGVACELLKHIVSSETSHNRHLTRYLIYKQEKIFPLIFSFSSFYDSCYNFHSSDRLFVFNSLFLASYEIFELGNFMSSCVSFLKERSLSRLEKHPVNTRKTFSSYFCIQLNK